MEPKQINKAFSEFIRNRMEKTGLNQSELARRTGVSQERISRIVNDESRISLQDFVILGSVLDADFIKELLSKMGENRIYYVKFQTKNLYHLIPRVWDMQHYDFHVESCSHILFQTPYSFEKRQTPIATRTWKPTQSVFDLRLLNGVWTPVAITKNCNSVCHFVQLQRELAQASRC